LREKDDIGNRTTYWTYTYIDYLINEGVVKSSDFTGHKKQITRVQMALICDRALEEMEGRE